VKLYDPYTGEEKYAGVTNASGVAEINNIIPNEYNMRLWKAGFDGRSEDLSFYANPTEYTREINPQ